MTLLTTHVSENYSKHTSLIHYLRFLPDAFLKCMPGHVCKAGNRTSCIIIIIIMYTGDRQWQKNLPVARKRGPLFFRLPFLLFFYTKQIQLIITLKLGIHRTVCALCNRALRNLKWILVTDTADTFSSFQATAWKNATILPHSVSQPISSLEVPRISACVDENGCE